MVFILADMSAVFHKDFFPSPYGSKENWRVRQLCLSKAEKTKKKTEGLGWGAFGGFLNQAEAGKNSTLSLSLEPQVGN